MRVISLTAGSSKVSHCPSSYIPLSLTSRPFFAQLQLFPSFSSRHSLNFAQVILSSRLFTPFKIRDFSFHSTPSSLPCSYRTMQFLRVSVLALSLVRQILAAPAILNTNVPVVDTVIRAVENLETSLNGIVSPARGAINPLVGRDTSAVITILGAVQSLEANVVVDLASLSTSSQHLTPV